MTAATAIEQLEASFAASLGVPGAVATGFGRGAIYLALEAIGVRGAEVLVPGLICNQVMEAVRLAGGRPVFYPVPLELAVQPAALAAAFTPAVRAAILVHYFGMPQPAIGEMVGVCRQRGIAVIEDCSLALLARSPAGVCGTLGDYATFSFTKNNWCYGGGMVVAREPAAADKMRSIREQKFITDDAFCEAYGQLREIDFEANRPSRAMHAAQRGLGLQRALGVQDPRFLNANFFDAAPCTIMMSVLAAGRAHQLLSEESHVAARKQALCNELRKMIGEGAGRSKAMWSRHSNGSFLPIAFPPGSAAAYIEAASKAGITLRSIWNDFQPELPQTLHAGRLAVLEVHSDLNAEEVGHIAQFLKGIV